MVRVDSWAQAQAVLTDFAARGLDPLTWQEHIPGREAKFYGVGPGRFLKAFWADTADGVPGRTLTALQELARQAAQAAGVAVFGGDAILPPGQDWVLIDLNDWPSFSACREAAAREIVQYVRQLWLI